jgi:hypothetical protein
MNVIIKPGSYSCRLLKSNQYIWGLNNIYGVIYLSFTPTLTFMNHSKNISKFHNLK